MKTALRACFLPPSTVMSMWHSFFLTLTLIWVMYFMIPFFQVRKLELRLDNLPKVIQLLNRRAGIEIQEIWPQVSSGDTGGVSWELENHRALWRQCSVVQVAGCVESTQVWKCGSYLMLSRDSALCHVPRLLTIWHKEFKFWDLNDLSSASFPSPTWLLLPRHFSLSEICQARFCLRAFAPADPLTGALFPQALTALADFPQDWVQM